MFDKTYGSVFNRVDCGRKGDKLARLEQSGGFRNANCDNELRRLEHICTFHLQFNIEIESADTILNADQIARHS